MRRVGWLVVLCWVLGCAGGAFARGQSALLSPEFLHWREGAARGRDRASGPAGERPTGYVPSPVDLSHLDGADYSRFLGRRSDRGDATLPVSYDLRAEGRVTPVRDQGPFGTCWSFAAIGAAESSYLTQGLGGTPDLSEMHLAWFTYMERGKGFTGRAGNVLSSPTSADVLRQEGNNFKSTATLARWTGAVSEDSLPYETEPSPDKSASDYPNRLHLRDVFYLGRDRKKPDDMVWKTLIRRYGAISIAYCSDPQYYTRYGVSF